MITMLFDATTQEIERVNDLVQDSIHDNVKFMALAFEQDAVLIQKISKFEAMNTVVYVMEYEEDCGIVVDVSTVANDADLIAIRDKFIDVMARERTLESLVNELNSGECIRGYSTRAFGSTY